MTEETRIVSLTELKNHLRITDTNDDTLLSSLLSAAEDQVESYLGYSIAHSDEYEEEYEIKKLIYLNHAPCVSVESIIDKDDEEYDDNDYTILPLGIIRLSGTISGEEGEILTITYEGGYESAPEAIKLAVKIIVESLYNRLGSHGAKSENTGGYSVQYVDDIPPTAKTLLGPYRRIRI